MLRPASNTNCLTRGSFWPTYSSIALRRRINQISKTGRGTKWQRVPLPHRHPPKTATNPLYAEPDYFEKAAAAVPVGPGYLEELSKLYNDKLSTERDLFFKREDNLIKAGSNQGLPTIHPSTPRLGYERVEGLKNSSDTVKRIFSVEYGERKDMTDLWTHKILESVREIPTDQTSLQTKIAMYTARIRGSSELFDDIAKQTEKKPRWLVNTLKKIIDLRRECLNQLRDQDLQSFNRILKQLKISYYTTEPVNENSIERTRRGWILAQVRKRVEAEKEEKLESYRQKLLKQKTQFLAEKEVKMKALREEDSRLRKDLAALTTDSGGTLDVVGKYQGHTLDTLTEEYNHRYYYSSTWHHND